METINAIRHTGVLAEIRAEAKNAKAGPSRLLIKIDDFLSPKL